MDGFGEKLWLLYDSSLYLGHCAVVGPIWAQAVVSLWTWFLTSLKSDLVGLVFSTTRFECPGHSRKSYRGESSSKPRDRCLLMTK